MSWSKMELRIPELLEEYCKEFDFCFLTEAWNILKLLSKEHKFQMQQKYFTRAIFSPLWTWPWALIKRFHTWKEISTVHIKLLIIENQGIHILLLPSQNQLKCSIMSSPENNYFYWTYILNEYNPICIFASIYLV